MADSRHVMPCDEGSRGFSAMESYLIAKEAHSVYIEALEKCLSVFLAA
ncbi:hypothetical protein [Piscirickettsia salmonis]